MNEYEHLLLVRSSHIFYYYKPPTHGLTFFFLTCITSVHDKIIHNEKIQLNKGKNSVKSLSCYVLTTLNNVTHYLCGCLYMY